MTWKYHQDVIEESTDLALVYNNVKQLLKKGGLSDTEKKEQQQLVKLFSISEDGKKGAPLMQNYNVEAGDVSFGQLNKLLDLSARGWYADNDQQAKESFVKAVRYMLNQGFAWEAAWAPITTMGTRSGIFSVLSGGWKDVLRANNLWEDARKRLPTGVACRKQDNLLIT